MSVSIDVSGFQSVYQALPGAFGLVSGLDIVQARAVGTDLYVGGNLLTGTTVETFRSGIVGRLEPSGALTWTVLVRGDGQESLAGLAASSDRIFACGVYASLFGEVVSRDVSSNVTEQSLPSVLSRSSFVGAWSLTGEPQWRSAVTGSFDKLSASVAAHPTNGTLVLAGRYNSGSARLWDASNSTYLSLPPAFDYTPFLAAYNGANGTPLWVATVDGTMDDEATSVAVGATGDVFVAGRYGVSDGNAQIYDASGSSPVALPAAKSDACFIAKLSSTGQFQWVAAIDGTGREASPLLEVTSDGVYCLCSYASSDATATGGGVSLPLPATTEPACALVKFGLDGAPLWTAAIKAGASCSPSRLLAASALHAICVGVDSSVSVISSDSVSHSVTLDSSGCFVVTFDTSGLLVSSSSVSSVSSVSSAPAGVTTGQGAFVNSSGAVGFVQESYTNDAPQVEGGALFEFTATVDGGTIVQTASVSFLTPAASDANSALLASAPETIANDESSVTLTAFINSAAGFPIPGITVSLSQSPVAASTITPTSAVTDENGKAAFAVRSSLPGSVTYALSVVDPSGNNTVLGSASVTYTQYIDLAASTVTTSKANVVANGSDFAEVSVTMQDVSGNAIPNRPVTLTDLTTGATIDADSVTTDQAGLAVFTVRKASTLTPTSVSHTFAASMYGQQVTATRSVTFWAPVLDITLSSLTPSVAQVWADGSSTATLTALAANAYGLPLPGVSVSLAQTPGAASVIDPSGAVLTDHTGSATFVVSSAELGTISYAATFDADSNASVTTTVEYIEFLDLTASTIVASKSAALADGNDATTLTVTLLDLSGGAVPGYPVTLSDETGGSTIAAATVATSSTGQASFSVTKATSAVTLAHIFGFTARNVTSTNKATVTFHAPSIDVSESGAAFTIDSSGNTIVGLSLSKTGQLLTIAAAPTALVLGAYSTASAQADWTASFTGAQRDYGVGAVAASDSTVYASAYATAADGAFQVVDASGNSLSASVTLSEGAALVLLKLSAVGSHLWHLLVQGTAVEFGHSITVDVSGNLYVAGTMITGAVDLQSADGTTKQASTTASFAAFLAKYDTNGTLIWATAAIENISPNTAPSLSVNDAGVITLTATLAGAATINHANGTSLRTISASSGTGAVAVVYEPTGTARWAALLDGPGDDLALATCTTPSGGLGVVVTGSSISVQNASDLSVATASGTVLVSYSPDGSFAWLASISGLSFDGAVGLSVDEAGSTYLQVVSPAEGFSVTSADTSVQTAGPFGARATTVVKFDQAGAMVLASSIEGAGLDVSVIAQAVTSSSIKVAGLYVGTVSVVGSSQSTLTAVSSPSAYFVELKQTAGTLVASPGYLLGDGKTRSTITVLLRNSAGLPLPGKTISLAQTSGEASVLHTTSAISDASGAAVFQVSSTRVGTVVYEATAVDLSGNVSLGSAQVGYLQYLDLSGSTIAVDRSQLLANGADTATLTARVLDVSGNPVAGVAVSFDDSVGGTLVTAQATTDLSGLASVLLRKLTSQSTVEHTYRFSVFGYQFTPSASATFSAPIPSSTASSVLVDVSRVLADGVSVANLSVSVRNVDNLPLPGITVALAQGSAASQIQALNDVTDAEGIARFTVNSGTVGTVTYTVSASSLGLGSASIDFFSSVDLGKSIISIDKVDVLANGFDFATVAVTLLGLDGRFAQNVLVTLLDITSGATINSLNATTDSTGTARFQVFRATSYVTQSHSFGFSVAGVQAPAHAALTFWSPVADPSRSTVAVDNASCLANNVDTRTITVTVKNENGMVVPNVPVALTKQASISTIINSSTMTAADGKAYFTVLSNAAGQVVYVPLASYAGLSDVVLASATVDFLRPITNATNSTISAFFPFLTANGVNTLGLQAVIRDDSDVPIPNREITFTSSIPGVVFNPPTKISDETGSASIEMSAAWADVSGGDADSNPGLIHAEADGVAFQVSGSVVFENPIVDAIKSSVVSSATIRRANGVDTSEVLVTLRDTYNVISPGKEVVMTSNLAGAGIAPSSAVTDASGNALFVVTAPSTPGTATFVATSESVAVSMQPAVQYVDSIVSPDVSSVIQSTDEVQSNGQDLCEIAVTVRNAANQVLPLVTVSVSDDGLGTAVNPLSTAVTNEGGTVVFNVSSSQQGLAKYTVVADGVTLSTVPTVLFTTSLTLLADNAVIMGNETRLLTLQSVQDVTTPMLQGTLHAISYDATTEEITTAQLHTAPLHNTYGNPVTYLKYGKLSENQAYVTFTGYIGTRLVTRTTVITVTDTTFSFSEQAETDYESVYGYHDAQTYIPGTASAPTYYIYKNMAAPRLYRHNLAISATSATKSSLALVSRTSSIPGAATDTLYANGNDVASLQVTVRSLNSVPVPDRLVTLRAETTLGYEADVDVKWAMTYGSSSLNLRVFGLAVDTDSNQIMFSAYLFSNNDVTIYDTNNSAWQTFTRSVNHHCYITKTDPDGSIKWVVRVHSNSLQGISNSHGGQLACDASGNVFVGLSKAPVAEGVTIVDAFGVSKVIMTNTSAAIVLKLSPEGVLLWSTGFIGTEGTTNSLADVSVTGVACDAQGDVYMYGRSSASLQALNGDGGYLQLFLHKLSGTSGFAFLTKFNPAGTLQWHTQIDDMPSSMSFQPLELAVSGAGDAYLTGYNFTSGTIFAGDIVARNAGVSTSGVTLPRTTSGGGFLIRYDSAGQFSWVASIDGGNRDYSSSITITPDGGVALAGTYNYRANIYHANGTIAKEMPFIQNTDTFTGFIAKYTSSGFVEWATNIANVHEQNKNLRCDTSGNLYLVATVTALAKTYNADGTLATTLNVVNRGSILFKYSPSGMLMWVARAFDGFSFDQGGAVAVDAQGGVYVGCIGQNGSAYSSQDTATRNLSTPEGRQVSLVKYMPGQPTISASTMTDVNGTASFAVRSSFGASFNVIARAGDGVDIEQTVPLLFRSYAPTRAIVTNTLNSEGKAKPDGSLVPISVVPINPAGEPLPNVAMTITQASGVGTLHDSVITSDASGTAVFHVSYFDSGNVDQTSVFSVYADSKLLGETTVNFNNTNFFPGARLKDVTNLQGNSSSWSANVGGTSVSSLASYDRIVLADASIWLVGSGSSKTDIRQVVKDVKGGDLVQVHDGSSVQSFGVLRGQGRQSYEQTVRAGGVDVLQLLTVQDTGSKKFMVRMLDPPTVKVNNSGIVARFEVLVYDDITGEQLTTTDPTTMVLSAPNTTFDTLALYKEVAEGEYVKVPNGSLQKVGSEFVWQQSSFSTYVAVEFSKSIALQTLTIIDKDTRMNVEAPPALPNEEYVLTLESSLGTVNDLFSVRTYIQDANDASLADIDLIVNSEAVHARFASLSTDMRAARAEISGVGLNATRSTFGGRLLEIVALKLFGHARARAAIRNDGDFDGQPLHVRIADSMNSAFQVDKARVFSQYVGLIADRMFNDYNDVDVRQEFNFDGVAMQMPMMLRGAVEDSDSTHPFFNRGPIAGGSSVVNGEYNVPIRVIFK